MSNLRAILILAECIVKKNKYMVQLFIIINLFYPNPHLFGIRYHIGDKNAEMLLQIYIQGNSQYVWALLPTSCFTQSCKFKRLTINYRVHVGFI